jgi:uncharacterized protein with HEPN domain
MDNKDLFRLKHISDCIEKIEYLAHKLHNQDDFEQNWVEQDAIIRNLEVIGEASVHISTDLQQQYPEILWKEMRGMRNFVVHHYFGVELSEIWSTIINDIPLLKKQIQKIFEDNKDE